MLYPIELRVRFLRLTRGDYHRIPDRIQSPRRRRLAARVPVGIRTRSPFIRFRRRNLTCWARKGASDRGGSLKESLPEPSLKRRIGEVLSAVSHHHRKRSGLMFRWVESPRMAVLLQSRLPFSMSERLDCGTPINCARALIDSPRSPMR